MFRNLVSETKRIYKPYMQLAMAIRVCKYISGLRRGGHSACYEPCILDAAKRVVYRVDVPDAHLSCTKKAYANQLQSIPNVAGNYWICTNEPIDHCFNDGRNLPKASIAGMAVVYNGTSNKLRTRAAEHLLRRNISTKSGISVDLMYSPFPGAFFKCAWSSFKKKVPKVREMTYCDMNDFDYLYPESSFVDSTSFRMTCDALHLSDEEEASAMDHLGIFDALYFKNGIDVNDSKHRKYTWMFAYIEMDDAHIRSHVEVEWRRRHGTPALCSYSAR
jgi:hypothetical protein